MKDGGCRTEAEAEICMHAHSSILTRREPASRLSSFLLRQHPNSLGIAGEGKGTKSEKGKEKKNEKENNKRKEAKLENGPRARVKRSAKTASWRTSRYQDPRGTSSQCQLHRISKPAFVHIHLENGLVPGKITWAQQSDNTAHVRRYYYLMAGPCICTYERADALHVHWDGKVNVLDTAHRALPSAAVRSGVSHIC